MSVDSTLTITRRREIKQLYAEHDHKAMVARFGICTVCRNYRRWNEQMRFNMLAGGGRKAGKVRRARKS